MTDLIERLRDKAARFHRMHWKRDYEDISEAADEIERLQAEMDTDHVQHMLNIKRKDAEIERLKAELFTMRNVFHQQDAKIERLEAREDEHSRTEGGECPYCEIDRLRAVLEQIANLRPGYRFPDARDIAREALKDD